MKTQWVLRIICIVALVFFYVALYKVLIPRITAFGCMDDCNNFLGGYFLLHGKQLFSQIFFNHAPFMAPISEFVFWATKPQNLFEIVLRHRQFVMLFGLVSEVLLIIRFGPIALPFALFYELTKFYIGGDRFLAEGLIVYPMTYLLGIAFEKFYKKNLLAVDYFTAALSLWFILFIREPYTLAAAFLFGIILWNKKYWKIKRLALLLLAALSFLTLFSYNVSEFFYNVVYVNQTTLAAENADTGFLGIQIYRSFVYPILIFFQGSWNFFRYIELGLSALFLFVTGVFLWKKEWKWVVLLWITLGLANIRFVLPGQQYYGAFHLLPWYAMTICMTLFMSKGIGKKWVSSVVVAGLTLLLMYVAWSKGSYLHDKIDEHTEFITNYGNVLQVGNVVASLSSPKDTLFLDGSDDAIYLVSKRYSLYPYSWYTSLMPQYKKYTDARTKMFATNPPDFYYIACSAKTTIATLPKIIQTDYARLYNLDHPSCLWVKKSKLPEISDAMWQKAGEQLYYLQPHP